MLMGAAMAGLAFPYNGLVRMHGWLGPSRLTSGRIRLQQMKST
jgi:hypothetical protein